jgi:hypothetical protein
MKRNGSLAGIPYDTRRPTMARLKFTYWSAQNPRFFPPKVDGLGWGINFFWVVHPFRWRKARKAAPLASATSSDAPQGVQEASV